MRRCRIIYETDDVLKFILIYIINYGLKYIFSCLTRHWAHDLWEELIVAVECKRNTQNENSQRALV